MDRGNETRGGTVDTCQSDVSGIGPLLDSAPCGFVSFVDDGTIRAVNTTLLDMLGFERAELTGRHVESILTVGSRIFYQTHFFPLLRLHGRADEIFLLFRTKSGENVAALVNALRRERDGETVTDCILVRIRERQKFEDALLRARKTAEEANRSKSDFLAAMSHELRTPLNAIGGYVQLIEMEIHGPVTAAQQEALGRIGRSQQHLLSLINNVLDFAKIEAGRVEFRIEPVPLADALADVAPMIEPQLAAKGIDYDARVAPGIVVRADRERLRQILMNLLGNAAKFTDSGGQVTVEVTDREDGSRAVQSGMVFLRVSDTGSGIAREKQSLIFDPFVQVTVDRARRAAGTGLGLAISRDLARGMGGDLRVRSVEGEGSSFTLALPRE